jgi:hypothetical protein
MAYKGVPPKDDDARQRRNAPIFDKTPVKWDGIVRGPELPGPYAWCNRTKEWWQMWRESPQAMVMHDSDWESMLETALLHNRLWSNPSGQTPQALTNLTAEIRRRVAAFGATFEDRLKLRMSISSPATEAAEEAQIKADAESAVDYFSKLTQAAAEVERPGESA